MMGHTSPSEVNWKAQTACSQIVGCHSTGINFMNVLAPELVSIEKQRRNDSCLNNQHLIIGLV